MLIKRFVKQGLFLKNAGTLKQMLPAVAYHAPKEEWKGAGMNNLPIPEGDWQDDYSRRNMRYNIFLGSSIIVFIATVVAGVKSELIFYNFFPPEHYDADKTTR